MSRVSLVVSYDFATFRILLLHPFHRAHRALVLSHAFPRIRDAKIAALEKTSQDAEKLIAEARSEKMRHMDEVHIAQKKLADLESR